MTTLSVDLNPSVSLTSHNWNILSNLVSKNPNIFKTITFKTELFPDSPYWVIKEHLKSQVFEFHRSHFTNQRMTIQDPYGIIGLSLINPKIPNVILTEGVSDYFTAKLLNPDSNVLGLTTLSGTNISKALLINLFDNFVIYSDYDIQTSTNTGINNSMSLRTLLQSYNKQVQIKLPSSSFKDITDEFIFKLKASRI